jgi:hypothetical protein
MYRIFLLLILLLNNFLLFAQETNISDSINLLNKSKLVQYAIKKENAYHLKEEINKNYIEKFSPKKEVSLENYIKLNVQNAIILYKIFYANNLKLEDSVKTKLISEIVPEPGYKLNLKVDKLFEYDKYYALYSVYKENDNYFNDRNKKEVLYPFELSYDNYFLIGLDINTYQIRYLSGNFFLSPTPLYERVMLDTAHQDIYTQILESRLFQFQVVDLFEREFNFKEDYICYSGYSKVLSSKVMAYISVSNPDQITLKYWEFWDDNCFQYQIEMTPIPKNNELRFIEKKLLNINEIPINLRKYINIKSIKTPNPEQ